MDEQDRVRAVVVLEGREERAEVVMQEAVAVLEDERMAVEEVLGGEQHGRHGVGLGRAQAVHAHPPRRARAHGLLYAALVVGAHSDRHVGDAGRRHRVEDMEEDRLVADGKQMRGAAAVHRRPVLGRAALREDQTLRLHVT
jgi:hypothetical protein